MDTTKIKLICFDMDGTLTRNNAWYDFNVLMGVDPEYDLQLFNQYIEGTLAYDDWILKLRTEYKKTTKTRQEIESSLAQVTYADNARDVIRELKIRGYITAMITGAFDVTAFMVGQELGITHVMANTRCLFTPDDIFMDVVSYGDEESSKVIHLRYLCELLKLSPDECLTVGDGSNDIGLFDFTGNGVCFNSSSDRTKSHARHSIESLTDLLTLLD
jgi:phosphoserine phosphatase